VSSRGTPRDVVVVVVVVVVVFLAALARGSLRTYFSAQSKLHTY
jgi:hypothetical protein